MKIYVASSWRNEHQPAVVQFLRDLGHNVYDFRQPGKSFHWSEIDPEWRDWDIEEYVKGLGHQLAWDGFAQDFDAMQDADMCVLLLPCGRSAHLEAGWFVGQGKPVIVLLVGPVEPELMYKMAAAVVGGSDLAMALFELRKVLTDNCWLA